MRVMLYAYMMIGHTVAASDAGTAAKWELYAKAKGIKKHRLSSNLPNREAWTLRILHLYPVITIPVHNITGR